MEKVKVVGLAGRAKVNTSFRFHDSAWGRYARSASCRRRRTERRCKQEEKRDIPADILDELRQFFSDEEGGCRFSPSQLRRLARQGLDLLSMDFQTDGFWTDVDRFPERVSLYRYAWVLRACEFGYEILITAVLAALEDMPERAVDVHRTVRILEACAEVCSRQCADLMYEVGESDCRWGGNDGLVAGGEKGSRSSPGTSRGRDRLELVGKGKQEVVPGCVVAPHCGRLDVLGVDAAAVGREVDRQARGIRMRRLVEA